MGAFFGERRKKKLQEVAVLAVATGAGSGYVPGLPGTAGTMVAAILFWRFGPGSWWGQAALVGTAAIVAWVTASKAEEILKESDSPRIVVDEMAGLTLALFLIPLASLSLLLGFIFFRVLDIVKPYPTRLVLAGTSGGLAVVLDDLVAGAYANLLLRVVDLLVGLKWP